MAHLTKDHANANRWVTVYPVYLDSLLSIQEGRRLSLEKAVAAPKISELEFAMKSIKLNFRIEEDKKYSRDFTKEGRMRVQLKNTDGSPCLVSIPSRDALFAAIAEQIKLIPKRVIPAPSTKADDSAATSAKKAHK